MLFGLVCEGNCTEYLLARLSDPVRFSMPLRPSLEAVRKQLVELLLQPVRNYQNVSALVVGEKGCGKTLVSKLSTQNDVWCFRAPVLVFAAGKHAAGCFLPCR